MLSVILSNEPCPSLVVIEPSLMAFNQISKGLTQWWPIHRVGCFPPVHRVGCPGVSWSSLLGAEVCGESRAFHTADHLMCAGRGVLDELDHPAAPLLSRLGPEGYNLQHVLCVCVWCDE